MSNLVCSNLPHAAEHEGGVAWRRLRTLQSGIQVVGSAVSVRVHARHALQYLTRARVAQGSAYRPAAFVAIDPLHDVVARVHGIHAIRQHFNPETTTQAGLVERLRPERRSLDRGAQQRLRYTRVHVVRDGIDDRAVRGRLIRSLQTVPGDEALGQRLLQRGTEVAEGDAEVTDPRGRPQGAGAGSRG